MTALAIRQLTRPGPWADDPVLRDSRHKPAQAARDLELFLAWLELENLGARTISDYEWALARLLRTFPDRQLDEFTDGDIAFVLRTLATRRVPLSALTAEHCEFIHNVGADQFVERTYRREQA